MADQVESSQNVEGTVVVSAGTILGGTLQNLVSGTFNLGTTQRVRASAGTVIGTTVTNANTLILASNASRKEWWLVAEGTTTLYWGLGTGVTAGSAGNGFPLLPNQLIADDVYTGNIYGITTAGSIFVKYGEF